MRSTAPRGASHSFFRRALLALALIPALLAGVSGAAAAIDCPGGDAEADVEIVVDVTVDAVTVPGDVTCYDATPTPAPGGEVGNGGEEATPTPTGEVGSGTDEATPTPVEEPTETPVEEPTPDTTPVEEPTETPVEEPTPDTTPVEEPTETPVEEPTPDTTPVEEPTETPVEEEVVVLPPTPPPTTGAAPEPPAEVLPRQQLAQTGDESSPMAAAGVALLVGGVGMVLTATSLRRRGI